VALVGRGSEVALAGRGGPGRPRLPWSAEAALVGRGGPGRPRWPWSAEVALVGRGGPGRPRLRGGGAHPRAELVADLRVRDRHDGDRRQVLDERRADRVGCLDDVEVGVFDADLVQAQSGDRFHGTRDAEDEQRRGHQDRQQPDAGADLSMGPFCVTRSNPTRRLTDPTRPNPAHGQLCAGVTTARHILHT